MIIDHCSASKGSFTKRFDQEAFCLCHQLKQIQSKFLKLILEFSKYCVFKRNSLKKRVLSQRAISTFKPIKNFSPTNQSVQSLSSQQAKDGRSSLRSALDPFCLQQICKNPGKILALKRSGRVVRRCAVVI